MGIVDFQFENQTENWPKNQWIFNTCPTLAQTYAAPFAWVQCFFVSKFLMLSHIHMEH